MPVQRPQEALTVHAVDATVRTLNAASGPATGAAIELAVTTGDAIDNAQWNEVQAFLALFDGGLVVPNSGGPGYAGVQSLDWPDDIFWKPDGVAAAGPDFFRRAFGFPHHPGLLERAVREFSAVGLRVPWLSCFGNHEALDQGVGIVTEGLAEALVGARKPIALPEDFDHDRALELLTERPEVFMAGPATQITADHRSPGGHPAGVRAGPFPARLSSLRARVQRAEPARRHGLLRVPHARRPLHRAGHHLPRGRGGRMPRP